LERAKSILSEIIAKKLDKKARTSH
jgi:hypothetical protein